MKYKTRNPCTVKRCSEKGCCLNCIQYKGSLEFIPTVLSVNCKHYKSVSLKLHGYPKINGTVDTNCAQWKGEIK
jgi:hypothetical protein